MAEVKLANIKPTINIAMVSRKRCATTKTATKTMVLPAVEAKIIPYDDKTMLDKKEGKSPAPKITNATPKLAPELNPSTYGPASGLRKSVCISKPLTDNPMPTSIAVIALGNR